MKLLKLSSSNPAFKTLEFKSGLNILAGLQLTDSEKKTYNGIGKSFSLNLIHLMLGARLDKNIQKERKILDFLSGYGSFYLEFSHQGTVYEITKDFSETHYYINKEKCLQTNYPGKLKDIFFGNNLDSQISFKQILNSFARRFGGSYYSDVTTQQGRPRNDYYQMYCNLYLLGIDTTLVTEKLEVKQKLDRLEKAKKVIEDYEALLEDSNIKDLQDEMDQLIEDRDNFIIAENYDKFKNEADELTIELNSLRNLAYECNKSISRKLESLEQSKLINIDIDAVMRVYEEAKFFFEDKISVRLEQANEFHLTLMKNRVNRLETEIKILETQAIEYNDALSKKETKRDSILKDLNSKGALEEYNSINERIRSLEREIQELERYKTLLDGFTKEKSELNLENAKVNAKSIEYLANSESHLNDIENRFRRLVKRFYENHGGSFKITETTDAKYLYNIDVHVPRDGSQGISEVKIFCYDFLLFQLNPDLLGFMAHDGSLFSEMDPRQKSMIFKVALDFIENYDLQYFVNIGEASLNEVLDDDKRLNILTEEEKEKVANSVRLKLFDKDPSKWLFGQSFG